MQGTFVGNGEHINRARRPALAYSLMWWKPITYRWNGRWLGQQLSFSENANSVQKTRNRKPVMTFAELLAGLDSLEQASDMCG